jgi:mercuric ion transport protein
MRSSLLTGAGGVVAALLGSLCCVGPLLFVTLGVGAGFATAFEPLRPLFGVLMLALLAAGFYAVYGRPTAAGAQVVGSSNSASASCDPATDPACVPASTCATPSRRRRDVAVLWTATALAVVLWTFPTWSLWLL